MTFICHVEEMSTDVSYVLMAASRKARCLQPEMAEAKSRKSDSSISFKLHLQYSRVQQTIVFMTDLISEVGLGVLWEFVFLSGADFITPTPAKFNISSTIS